MHKKFEINRTKIKGGFQSRRKVVTHNSKSDLPLNSLQICLHCTAWNLDMSLLDSFFKIRYHKSQLGSVNLNGLVKIPCWMIYPT